MQVPAINWQTLLGTAGAPAFGGALLFQFASCDGVSAAGAGFGGIVHAVMLLVLCRGGAVCDAGGGGSSAAGVAVASVSLRLRRGRRPVRRLMKKHTYREY